MRFLKETYILFCSTALSALFSLVTGIWIRNTLGSKEYGVWLIFSMILTYGYYLNLGFLDGFNRDIPRLLGEKKYRQVQRLRNVVFTWMLSSACFIIFILILIMILPLSPFEKILSILSILLIPLQNMTLFHNNLFLTTQQFNTVAVIQLLIGSFQYVLMAIFSLFGGIYGLFLGILVGNLIAILYSRFRLTYKLNIEWDWNIFKGMLSYGVPITLIGILLSLLTSLDRLIVFLFFGPDSVGHYGLIPLIYQGIMVLPNVYSQVMYPKISYTYGAAGEKRKLKTIVVNPSIHIAYLSPLLLGPLFFIFPWFVKLFMPQYVAGIDAAQIVIIGMFFFLWSALYAQYLTVVNKQWTYLKILSIAVFINAILNISFIKMGFHLDGVALGTAISYIIYPMLLMWCCYKDMGEKVVEFGKAAALVTAPFIVMIVMIMVINQFEFKNIEKVFLFLVLYVIFLVISSLWISILISLRRKAIGYIRFQLSKRNKMTELSRLLKKHKYRKRR